MPFEILGLGILALVAIVLFLVGLGIFKTYPLVGFLAGLGALFIFLGVMLSAFGGVGFYSNFLQNSWIQYLLVGSASYFVGAIIGALF